jgi:hypothetical protein
VIAVLHRRVLRHDRDTSLTLEIHRIHDAFNDGLIVAICARLLQHCIDERRLPVIDVSDDGDVSNLVRGDHSGEIRP